MKSFFATIVFYVFVVGFLNLAYDGRHSIKNGVVSPPLNQLSKTERFKKIATWKFGRKWHPNLSYRGQEYTKTLFSNRCNTSDQEIILLIEEEMRKTKTFPDSLVFDWGKVYRMKTSCDR